MNNSLHKTQISSTWQLARFYITGPIYFPLWNSAFCPYSAITLKSSPFSTSINRLPYFLERQSFLWARVQSLRIYYVKFLFGWLRYPSNTVATVSTNCLKTISFLPTNCVVCLIWFSYSAAIICPKALTDWSLWRRHCIVLEVGTKCLRICYLCSWFETLGKRQEWSTPINSSEFRERSSLSWSHTSSPQWLIKEATASHALSAVAQQPYVGLGRFIVDVLRSHTIRHTHPIGLLSTSDQLVAEATTYTTHNKHNRP